MRVTCHDLLGEDSEHEGEKNIGRWKFDRTPGSV